MNKKPVKGSIEQLPQQATTKITSLKTQLMQRRLMDDNAGLTNHPDRRVKNSERRNLETVRHTSPVRRYTIDRRTCTKDRRISTKAA